MQRMWQNGCHKTHLPFCPCNYCKKDGHIADNCTRAQKSKDHRPVGSFANENPASGGPLSNPFSTKPRKNQQRLPPRHDAGVTAGSGAVATSSADGGGSRGPGSDSPGRHFSQRSSALDTSLSHKRKMEPESEPENARKKSMTTPTTLTPNVSPLLDAEVGYPDIMTPGDHWAITSAAQITNTFLSTFRFSYLILAVCLGAGTFDRPFALAGIFGYGAGGPAGLVPAE